MIQTGWIPVFIHDLRIPKPPLELRRLGLRVDFLEDRAFIGIEAAAVEDGLDLGGFERDELFGREEPALVAGDDAIEALFA